MTTMHEEPRKAVPGPLASQVEVLNHLASNAPLTVRFHYDGLPTLEPMLISLPPPR